MEVVVVVTAVVVVEAGAPVVAVTADDAGVGVPVPRHSQSDGGKGPVRGSNFTKSWRTNGSPSAFLAILQGPDPC